jgi:5-methylthioadenosine/S-adenosylhomocysteine deaminase
MLSTLILCANLLAQERADLIVSARYVVTMDASRRVIENGAVAVRGGEIVAVGDAAAIRREFRASRRLDRGEAIVMPGLINAHTHAPMSLFRGLADDLPLQTWLEKFIFPAEAKNLNPEFIRWGTRLACLEMLLGGTTTFVDMYYFEDLIAEETKRAGMRAILGQTVIQFPAPDHATPEAALEAARAYMQRFANDPLITPAVAPHALYTNRDESLRAARALANEFQKPLVIHLAETKREDTDTRAKRGASPTMALERLGVLNGWTIAAHAVWVDPDDAGILLQRGTGVAHCPSSNMKLASGVAPVLRMLRLGIPVGLGTDGPAGSNNDFNLFEEMDLASKLAKVTENDPEALPARKTVEMATIGGAKAIGLQAKIGSLERGKRADLIAIRLDRPHAAPLFDVYSQIVYALKASDVRDVLIDGRMVVRDGRPLTLDQAAILRQAAEYRARIAASLKR